MDSSSFPSLADFTRLTAMVAALRPALTIAIKHIGEDWVSLQELANSSGISEESAQLQCLALKNFGWIEISTKGVRRKRLLDGVFRDEQTWLEIIDYYSDFAAREFPLQTNLLRRPGDYHPMLLSIAPPTTNFLLTHLIGRGELQILDFGCGLAPHTRSILRAIPGSIATLVDNPLLLDTLKLEVTRDNLESFVRIVPWTSFDVTPGTFDVVLLLNVLHELPAREQGEVIHKLAQRLRPNAELIIQVFCRDLAPRWHADALEMATLIRVGVKADVLSLSSYISYLEAADLQIVEMPDIATPAGPSNRLLIARS